MSSTNCETTMNVASTNTNLSLIEAEDIGNATMVDGHMKGLVIFILLLIITGGTIGHALLFLVFYRSKHFTIAKNVYHVNLSIFDMIACCVQWPIIMSGQLVYVLHGGMLAFTTGLVGFVTMGNVLSLSFIAQTRKTQIYHPTMNANVQGYFPRLITIWILSVTT